MEVEMRIARIVLPPLLGWALVCPPVPAADPSWTLRFHGAIVDSSARSERSLDGGASSRLAAGGGLGIAAERRLAGRVGLELSALFAGVELRSRVSTTGVEHDQLGMVPVTFGLPFHFDRSGRVDFFVAPTLGVVRYTDLRAKVGAGETRWSTDAYSDFAVGAAVGLDVPFGKKKWAFSSGLRYLKTDADGYDVDPVIATVGFARRF
jgi:hypothetical protein